MFAICCQYNTRCIENDILYGKNLNSVCRSIDSYLFYLQTSTNFIIKYNIYILRGGYHIIHFHCFCRHSVPPLQCGNICMQYNTMGKHLPCTGKEKKNGFAALLGCCEHFMLTVLLECIDSYKVLCITHRQSCISNYLL